MRQALSIQVYSLGEISPQAEVMFRELTAPTVAEKAGFPRLRAVETADSFVIIAALPGIAREDLDVSVMSDRVILRGKRAFPPAAGEILRDELLDGDFERVIKLPRQVAPATALWSLENGLLNFEVQHLPDVSPERISEVGPENGAA
ncbi:MAG: Hsp20/alpha crystallin family protein [Phycisphaerales bacterium]